MLKLLEVSTTRIGIKLPVDNAYFVRQRFSTFSPLSTPSHKTINPNPRLAGKAKDFTWLHH